MIRKCLLVLAGAVLGFAGLMLLSIYLEGVMDAHEFGATVGWLEWQSRLARGAQWGSIACFLIAALALAALPVLAAGRAVVVRITTLRKGG